MLSLRHLASDGLGLSPPFSTRHDVCSSPPGAVSLRARLLQLAAAALSPGDDGAGPIQDGQTGGQASPGSSHVWVDVLYVDPQGNDQLGRSKIGVLRSGGSCEFRLEYDSIKWPIGEVTGDQGDPQHHHSPDCLIPGFTTTAVQDPAHHEAQTAYYWVMQARQYAIDYLWRKPSAMPDSEPTSYAFDGVRVQVLDGGFANACLPNPKHGCFRSWPWPEGNVISFKAGTVKPELVAHEFGHYAAGFVFRHTELPYFEPWNVWERAFQEGPAEIFLSLFLHHEEYEHYLKEDPIRNGVPTSGPDFRLTETDTWSSTSSGDEYAIAAPVAQAFHKALWDDIWPNATTANRQMVAAFSAALSRNHGHDLFMLAGDILDYLRRTQTSQVYERMVNIFGAHGFQASGKVRVIHTDFEPVAGGGYDLPCPGSNLTYSDVRLFRPVIRLDAPSPGGFELAYTIQAHGSLSHPTLGTFGVRFEAGDTEPSSVTTPNVIEVVEQRLSMDVKRMPDGAPPIETRGFWLGCTKKCVVRGNGPKGNAGPQDVYLKMVPHFVPDDPTVVTYVDGVEESPAHTVKCVPT